MGSFFEQSSRFKMPLIYTSSDLYKRVLYTVLFNCCGKINIEVRDMNCIKIINNTINYLEEILTKDIKVRISSKYHFSKFHFYRIFRALSGDSISEYINLKS